MALSDIHFSKEKGPAWPVDDKGNNIAPAFLEHVGGDAMALELEVNLLNAYNIPTLCDFPHDGEFARVIMGCAPIGTDIYVPETLLEDAKNIISCDMSEEENDVSE